MNALRRGIWRINSEVKALLEVVSTTPSRSFSIPSGAHGGSTNNNDKPWKTTSTARSPSILPKRLPQQHPRSGARLAYSGTHARLAFTSRKSSARSQQTSNFNFAAVPGRAGAGAGASIAPACSRAISTGARKFTSSAIDIPSVGSIPSRWLLDHCRCGECIDAETGQKLTRNRIDHPRAVPASVERSKGDSDSVTITWRDPDDLGWSHVSVFEIKWLEEHSPGRGNAAKAKEDAQRKRSPWGVFDRERCTFRYEDFVGGEVEPGKLLPVLEAIDKVGLAIVEGCPTDAQTVRGIGESIGGLIRPTFYGETFDVEVKETADNLAYTGHKIPLHQDLCYFAAIPGLQLLLCAEQTIKEGGETYFVDGYHVIELMRANHPDELDALARIPATFHYRYGTERREKTRPLVSKAVDGRTLLAYSPPWMGTLDFESVDDVDVFYNAFEAFEKTAESIEPFSLRLPKGTCVIFDNQRILHARNAFEVGPGESRLLHGCYVDMDDYSSALAYQREVVAGHR